MARVDIVIVAYNSGEHLRECVQELAECPWANVVVVDNASPDDTAAAVRDLPLTLVREPVNRGFAAGCNAGWRSGSAPYVLFLNPDATIDPDALEKLVGVLDQDARAGAAGPLIVDADGTLDYSIRSFPRLSSTYAQALFLHRLVPNASWVDEVVRDRSRYTRPGDADWLSGACLLIRRSLLEGLDGWDEGFFMYSEDADICRRIWDAGFTVRFEPAAVVSHEGGASAPRAALLPVLAASRARYAVRHRGRAAALVDRMGVALGAVTHSVVGRGGADARSGHRAAAAAALRAARS